MGLDEASIGLIATAVVRANGGGDAVVGVSGVAGW